MRTKDDAFGPGGGEASVLIRVEVGEKVGDGVIAGISEAVNDEAGVGDHF